MTLPIYTPPSARHAAVAAGLSPLLVLLSFTLLVCRQIEADTALASMLALTVWVVVEMTRYQRAVDQYNQAFARRHLDWRSARSVRELAADPQLPDTTRDFIDGYLAAGCTVRRDGQVT